MITELPTMYRTVFNLRAIEDYSYEEIAEMLNIKEVALRSQFMRARQMLREKVMKFF
jgi:RNA polymerase sigma-70 factor (ECF subfamily)